MLLTITLTKPPATYLGFLLHMSPGHIHMRSLSFGPAHFFYPEATDDRCTAALLLDIDPVGLVRGRRPRGQASSARYTFGRTGLGLGGWERGTGAVDRRRNSNAAIKVGVRRPGRRDSGDPASS